jgi:hypothetical protein
VRNVQAQRQVQGSDARRVCSRVGAEQVQKMQEARGKGKGRRYRFTLGGVVGG